MKTFLYTRTVVIAPLVTENIAAQGSFFWCAYASFSFKLGLDGDQEFDMDQGINFSADPGEQWRVLRLRNPSSSLSLTVQFYFGSAQMRYSSPNTFKQAPTFSRSSANQLAQDLTAQQTKNFSGVSAEGYIRKQIMFFNCSAAMDLQVIDAAGKLVGLIPPRQSWSIESSGPIGLKNANDQTVQYIAGETFYS